MRFIFVDRILRLEPGRAIETLKNASMSEDVFADHFPGCPVLPGALIVECFDQAAQVLIAVTHDFARTGRLARISRGAFRHFVRPGDQLRVTCARRGEGWTIDAEGRVDGRRVATAALDYAVEEVAGDPARERAAKRLRALVRELQRSPLDLLRSEMPA